MGQPRVKLKAFLLYVTLNSAFLPDTDSRYGFSPRQASDFQTRWAFLKQKHSTKMKSKEEAVFSAAPVGKILKKVGISRHQLSQWL
jgi:hypothetical protein